MPAVHRESGWTLGSETCGAGRSDQQHPVYGRPRLFFLTSPIAAAIAPASTKHRTNKCRVRDQHIEQDATHITESKPNTTAGNGRSILLPCNDRNLAKQVQHNMALSYCQSSIISSPRLCSSHSKQRVHETRPASTINQPQPYADTELPAIAWHSSRESCPALKPPQRTHLTQTKPTAHRPTNTQPALRRGYAFSHTTTSHQHSPWLHGRATALQPVKDT
jgi:hypothetical protein